MVMPAIWSRNRATAMPLGIRIADVIQSADKTLHAVPHDPARRMTRIPFDRRGNDLHFLFRPE